MPALPHPNGLAALGFSPPPSIQAGEPLAFSWRLQRRLIHESDAVGTSVIASLLVNGTEIWSSLPTMVYVTNIIGDFIDEDTGSIQETLSFVPTGQAAFVLYAAGVKALELRVVGNGPHGSPFTAQTSLTVVPASFSGVWWSWNPRPANVDWKAAYSLAGVFSNISTAPLTLLASLVQNAATDGSITPLETLNLGSVGSATNTGSVAFNSIMQSWQWFDDVTFLQTAPMVESFIYTVTLNAQDPWGNQYQATSSALPLLVSVPSWKQTDEGLAASAASTATVLLAAAGAALLFPGGELFAAGLFGAAAVAYASAQALGTSAKDPPEPDSAFRDTVEAKSVEVPAALSGSPTLDALANLFRTLLQIAADHEALAVTQGRILGALNASDRDALDLQIRKYTEVMKHMNELALQLPTTAGAAIQSSQADPALDPTVIRNVLSQWKQTGVPTEVREVWLAQELPQEILSAIESVIIRGSPIEVLTISMPQQLASLSLGIVNWVASAAGQRFTSVK